jgi:predicted transcriptional regulator
MSRTIVCAYSTVVLHFRVFAEVVMSTTTIRLPDDLKARIASAAERAGKTTHSFILEAIAEKAELEEQRADFDAEADSRFAKIVASGKTIPWTDMRQYLEGRVAGKQILRPVAKKNRP